MSLGIAKLIVTPMQRVIVKITAADPLPIDYEITLVPSSTTHGQVTVTQAFEDLRYRSPQLFLPENYDLSVEARYADPLDNQTYVRPDPVALTPRYAMATMLRQSIWDILFEADLELDDRPLKLVHDGYFQPAILPRSAVPDMAMPALEVGMPLMRTTKFQSKTRKVEEWRVPMRILDHIHKENTDELGRVWMLCEDVQGAVDLTDNLNLAGRGVLDHGWSWRVMEDPDPERDRMSGLRLWLTVFVQRPVGGRRAVAG